MALVPLWLTGGGISQAQVPGIRLSLPGAVEFERAGDQQHQAVAVGSGRMAFGSGSMRNGAGVATGGVRIFDEQSGRFLFSLSPADGSAGDGFGRAVAIWGNRIAIGAPNHDPGGLPNSGAVYIYDLNTRALIQKMSGGPFFANESAGTAIAMEGNYVAVGIPAADNVAPNDGLVIIWEIGDPASEWTLARPGAMGSDRFGYSVSMHDGLVAVGAPFCTVGGMQFAGEVLIFDVKAGTHLGTAHPTGHSARDFIGTSVAMDRHLLVAGGSFSERLGVSQGLVATWYLQDPTNPVVRNVVFGNTVGERLGTSVSVNQGMIAVGAHRRSAVFGPAHSITGAVDLFDADLNRITTLAPAGLAADDNFGSSVSLNGGTLAVSAPFDSTVVNEAGGLWKFSPILRRQSQLFSLVSATTGEAVAGVAEANYADFPEVAATGGIPSMIATLSGAGARGGRGLGVWSSRHPADPFALNGRTGIEVGGVRFVSFRGLLDSGNDHFWIRGRRAGTGITSANADGLFECHSLTGFFSPLLTGGSILPDGSTVASIGEARLSGFSNVGVAVTSLVRGSGLPVVNRSSDTALAIIAAGGVVGTIREGVSISPLGTPYGQIPPLAVTAGNRSAGIMLAQLGAGVTTADNQFVLDDMIAAARRGFPALDATGLVLGSYSGFTGVANSAAGVVFRGSMAIGAGVTSADNDGLWSNRSGSTRLISREGDLYPDGTGVRIRRHLQFGLTSNGDILSLVQLSGAGVNRSNDLAVMLFRNSGPEPGIHEPLLREGERAQSLGGARVGTIVSVDFDNVPVFANCHYGVLCTLAVERGVASAADNLIWMVGNLQGGPTRRLPVAVLRKGVRLQAPTGSDRVSSFRLGTRTVEINGALNSGRSHAVDGNFGASTLVIQYPNRTRAVGNLDF